jgi:hypothetical protein
MAAMGDTLPAPRRAARDGLRGVRVGVVSWQPAAGEGGATIAAATASAGSRPVTFACIRARGQPGCPPDRTRVGRRLVLGARGLDDLAKTCLSAQSSTHPCRSRRTASVLFPVRSSSRPRYRLLPERGHCLAPAQSTTGAGRAISPATERTLRLRRERNRRCACTAKARSGRANEGTRPDALRARRVRSSFRHTPREIARQLLATSVSVVAALRRHKWLIACFTNCTTHRSTTGGVEASTAGLTTRRGPYANSLGGGPERRAGRGVVSSGECEREPAALERLPAAHLG